MAKEEKEMKKALIAAAAVLAALALSSCGIFDKAEQVIEHVEDIKEYAEEKITEEVKEKGGKVKEILGHSEDGKDADKGKTAEAEPTEPTKPEKPYTEPAVTQPETTRAAETKPETTAAPETSPAETEPKESPEDIVAAVSEALKQFDLDKASTYTVEGGGESYDWSELGVPQQFVDYMKECAAQMTYEIKETEIKGDKANVWAEYRHIDSTPVVEAVMGEVLMQAALKALKGEEVGEDKIVEMMGESIVTQKNKVDKKWMYTTVEYELVKTADGWKVSTIPDELLTAVTANLVSALDAVTDALGTFGN